MKKYAILSLISGFLLITGFSCSENETVTDTDTQTQTISEPEYIDPAVEFSKTISTVETIDTDSLSEEEKAGLIYMREEEKLARDVYINFYQQYDLRPFNFISRSESFHMQAVLYLLNKYGVEDPVGDNDIGVFTNEELQNLYNQLIEQGSVDEIEALKVGAAIEEIDILDLINHISETDNADIQFVYSRLLMGSQHHLKAFVWNLHIRGIEYEPKYLNADLYNSIIFDE